MSHMEIALLGIGAGIVILALAVFLSTATTAVNRAVKRMRVSGKDLCAVCGTQIPRDAVYCPDHKHLAALRHRRPT